MAISFPTLVLVAGQGAITAGTGPAGWVSGDVRSLATSASASMIFDLGQNWEQYTTLQLHLFPSGGTPGTFSGFTSFTGNCSDTTTPDQSRRLSPRSVTAVSGTLFIAGPLTPGAGSVVYTVVPSGRYLHLSCTNGDATNTAGAASRMTVVMLAS